ncbi:MAG: isoprenyl transferase [Methylohalobius sp.]|nr:isoprenyl transferase [Methylohalobius sp.]
MNDPHAHTLLPRHVAIIMDGNGRWAKLRKLPRTAGHQAGVTAVRKTVEHCLRRGIEVLTLFAFSSENWRRPPEEVSVLMRLFQLTLEREAQKLHENDIRLQVIGDLTAFPGDLQRCISEVQHLTQANRRMTLAVAANYGGRWDIVQAAKALARQVERGTLTSEEIDESLFASHLSLADLPEPDLFIRTGGELRISNFLLWQLAYTEFYFSDVLWPDFDEAELDRALAEYARRERRFGHTSEQLEIKLASSA